MDLHGRPAVRLEERLETDLRSAMRAGDSERVTTLRLLRAALKNASIEARGPLSEEDVIAVLGRQAKQRGDSIEAYRAGRREDLAKAEERELAIILEYLPRQLGREEIEVATRGAIETLGASGPGDIGRVMGQLMRDLKGQADGRLVGEVVRNLLEA
jgi:hypothetical protein